MMIERVSRRRRARRGWRTSRPCWVSGMRRNRGSGVARRFGFPVRGEAEDPVVSVQHRCVGVGRARSPACAAAPHRHYPHAGVARLVAGHGTIVIEDLNVGGMTRNRRLARHVAGVGMGELRRQVEYKTGWSGVRLHIANRRYPSSKTCSGCGAVKTKLRVSKRTFRCDECGFVLDRDLNAARNLAALVGEVIGGTSSQSCGAGRR